MLVGTSIGAFERESSFSRVILATNFSRQRDSNQLGFKTFRCTVGAAACEENRFLVNHADAVVNDELTEGRKPGSKRNILRLLKHTLGFGGWILPSLSPKRLDTGQLRKRLRPKQVASAEFDMVLDPSGFELWVSFSHQAS